MLRDVITCLIVLCFLSGCNSKEEKNTDTKAVQSVDATYQKTIKEEVLKTINDPKSYQELSWKKLKSGDVVSSRIGKKVVFIAHSFKGKNIYGGAITRENIYFIGEGNNWAINTYFGKIPEVSDGVYRDYYLSTKPTKSMLRKLKKLSK